MIRHKGLVFVGAILLALAVTGGIFAYGVTTTTIGLDVESDQADFANVTACDPGPTWTVWGSHRGKVEAGDLFTITPTPGWTGDMSIILTIANAHDLIECYRILVLEIKVIDNYGTGEQLGRTEYLTLAKGEIDIDIDYSAYRPYKVKVTDGYYISHHGGWPEGKEDPLILCQVLQRSVPQ